MVLSGILGRYLCPGIFPAQRHRTRHGKRSPAVKGCRIRYPYPVLCVSKRICGAGESAKRIFWLCYGEYRGKRELKPFLRYVEARLDEHDREEAYRIYVTKSLQLAPQNKYVTVSFEECLKPRKVETRSGEQIAADIIKHAGLNFG